MSEPRGHRLGQVIHDMLLRKDVTVAGLTAPIETLRRREALIATASEWAPHMAGMVEALWGDQLDAGTLPPEMHDLIAGLARRG